MLLLVQPMMFMMMVGLLLPSSSAFVTISQDSSLSMKAFTYDTNEGLDDDDYYDTDSKSEPDLTNDTKELLTDFLVTIKPYASPSSSTTSRSLDPVGASVTDDFILIEMVRLVFKGNVVTANFAYKVYGLLESFLTRAIREVKTVDGFDWRFELTSTLRPIGVENSTTYMDFRIKHTFQKGIAFVFRELRFENFISQNSNLVFLAECWPHRNCQNGSQPELHQWSVFEKHIALFSAIIALCSLCFAVLALSLVRSFMWRKTRSKTDKDVERKECSKRHVANRISLSNENITRKETVDETSFSACAAVDDDLDDIHCTWFVPVHHAPGGPRAVVIVTTEDTSL